MLLFTSDAALHSHCIIPATIYLIWLALANNKFFHAETKQTAESLMRSNNTVGSLPISYSWKYITIQSTGQSISSKHPSICKTRRKNLWQS